MTDSSTTALTEEAESIEPWVKWFRGSAPYIHAHRGQTAVIGVAGEMIADGLLDSFVHDVSLMNSMGMRVVVVYGVRPQIDELIAMRKLDPKVVGGIRVTDKETLVCAKEAAGEIRLDFEAAFSQGMPNTPMAHSQVRVVSGNFVTARPLGVIDGQDYGLTGVVRKVDHKAINAMLDAGNIVLIPPLGFSPTGEAFNLTMEEAAASVASALKAAKLILMGNADGICRFDEVISEMTSDQAREFADRKLVDEDDVYNLKCAIKALDNGVSRVHIIPYMLDGGLLAELFTHEGVGTLITEDNMQSLRQATIDDVPGLIRLLEPLEDDGTLVRRPREKLEQDIGRFIVLEHDGVIFGSAALYPFPEEEAGEMAALTVHPTYQGAGDGERLLHKIESMARQAGLTRLFVLTTRTAHWFLKRGFRQGTVEELPGHKREMYNWQRMSKIFIKDI